MKKTLLRDSFREIKSTISRFLAILAIVALSTAFFTGIKITCPDMQFTGDAYFDAYNLMDFRIISTVGFDGKDIDSVRAVAGVEGVFPAYILDALVRYGSDEKVVSVHSLPSAIDRKGNDYINVPMVLEGRLPNDVGECVVEELFLPDVRLGQRIRLSSGKENKDFDFLRSTDLTVVGIVRSPLYVSKVRGNSTIGNGKINSYIYMLEEEFDLPVFNEIYLTMEGAKSFDTYSEEYQILADDMEKRLKLISDDRVVARYDGIVGYASDEYYQGESGYNKAVKDSLYKLKLSSERYEKGKQELYSAKIELDQAQRDIDKQEMIYNSEIATGLTTIEANERYIDSQLENVKDIIDRAKMGGYYDSQSAYLESSYNNLLKTKSEIERSKAILLERKLVLESSMTMDRAKLSASQEEFFKANDSMIASEKELFEGRKRAEDSLFIANSELDDALDKIKDIKDVKWHVLSREKNIGFIDFKNAALRMDAISKVFPLIFVFVAVLICLTTMGRMVEEQRGYIGTLKALGYSSFDILGKYLIYALSASIVGGVMGIAFGCKFFPWVIYTAYRELYILPDLIYLFDVPLAMGSLFVAVVFTCGAAIFVCYEALLSNSAELLRPKAPKAGTKIFLEKVNFIWSRLRFTQKVTARNLFRYKSRFFMTVIGVAGCSALLVVGFGLNDAISYIGDAQYGKVFYYDISASFSDDEDKQEQSVKDIVAMKNVKDFGEVMMLNVTGETEQSFDATMVVPKDIRSLGRFISLHERVGSEKLFIDDEGIIISEKLGKLLDVKVGDSIFVKVDDYERYNLVVKGLTENYFDHYIYMSPKLFEKTFVNEELVWNTLLINTKVSDYNSIDAFLRRVLDTDGVTAAVKNYENKKIIGDTISSINFIVAVLIICAGILSFIVLYTLTNINISERIREIATIKVLGFYDWETASYVFKENIILSLIGALVGLVLGGYLCLFVILTTEVEVLMFGRDIRLFSFVASLLITLLFSMMVNFIMLRKIKTINMVEALKTVD